MDGFPGTDRQDYTLMLRRDGEWRVGKAIDFAPGRRRKGREGGKRGVTFGPTNHDMKRKHDTKCESWKKNMAYI